MNIWMHCFKNNPAGAHMNPSPAKLTESRGKSFSLLVRPSARQKRSMIEVRTGFWRRFRKYGAVWRSRNRSNPKEILSTTAWKMISQNDSEECNGVNGVNGLACGQAEKQHEEYQYLNLIEKIMKKGTEKSDRTGVGTLSIFGTQMRFSLRDNTFPLLTTKQVFWRGVVEELLWFVRGSTNATELSSKNVRIWDANSSREFLDSCGFLDREEGDLGPVYGFQWRHFGAEYKDMRTDYKNEGIDQLKDVIDKIRNSPNDRRIIMSAWNPIDIPKMALPPCHCLVQFYVSDGELSCQLYQRSADMGLGVPFNIASYSLLTYMLAHVTNLKPGEFVHTMGDCHIYRNHVSALEKQIKRAPKPFPRLEIIRNVETIDDFTTEDFKLTGYEPHAKLPMPMAV